MNLCHCKEMQHIKKKYKGKNFVEICEAITNNQTKFEEKKKKVDDDSFNNEKKHQDKSFSGNLSDLEGLHKGEDDSNLIMRILSDIQTKSFLQEIQNLRIHFNKDYLILLSNLKKICADFEVRSAD